MPSFLIPMHLYNHGILYKKIAIDIHANFFEPVKEKKLTEEYS